MLLSRRFLLSAFYSKDVRLPVQLQRAMAAEAEAAREARAKVRFRKRYRLRARGYGPGPIYDKIQKIRMNFNVQVSQFKTLK